MVDPKRPMRAGDKRLRKGKRTVNNCSTSPRKILQTKATIEKAKQAVEYRLLGYTYRQIGEEMGIDLTRAYQLVNWAMGQVPSESVEELRGMQTARLESMLSSMMDKAIAGDAEAQNQSLRIMDMLNKLHGLLAAQRLEHSGEVQGAGPVIVNINGDDARL